LRIRVLLIDNSKAFLRAAADLLQRQRELTLAGAIHSEEALACVLALRPDLVLVGLDRPGLELIACLQNVLPNAGLLALAPSGDKTYWLAALAAGAHGLVDKVRLATDLVPAIRRVIRTKGGLYETS
jgi:DNA-binding NarL/FixJ family response regulator